jgi:hypothetical protein
MKVQIKDGSVQSAELKGASGTFTSKSQIGWVALSNGEVWKIRIRLPRDHGGYSAGMYDIADESFVRGKYDDLQLGNALVLRPVVAASQPAAAGAR